MSFTYISEAIDMYKTSDADVCLFFEKILWLSMIKRTLASSENKDESTNFP